jgi:hypothetical protein
MEELNCGQTTLRPRLGLFKFSGTSSCHFPSVHPDFRILLVDHVESPYLSFWSRRGVRLWGSEAKRDEKIVEVSRIRQ